MTVTIEDFNKLDIRIGEVIASTPVEGAARLIRLEMRFGEETRQIVTGMGDFFKAQHFQGKKLPVLMNLERRSFRGVESQGMLLAADISGRPVLLAPEEDVPSGSVVR